MKRRDFLKWNALAGAALCAPAAYQYAQSKYLLGGKAKSVVVLFMTGGPSQMELFDYKSELYKHHGRTLAEIDRAKNGVYDKASKILQPYKPLRQHGECGQWVSDLLPNMAKLVDEVTFIKTLQASNGNHIQSQLEFHTGVTFPGNPYIGAWIEYALKKAPGRIPQSFIINDIIGNTRVGNLAWSSGNLPVPDSKLVFSGVERTLDLLKNTPAKEQAAVEDFLKQAEAMNRNDRERLEHFRLIYSMREEVMEILEMSNLTEDERKLYGVDQPASADLAKQLIAARRMVEKEVPFVEVYCGCDVDPDITSWDNHLDIKAIETMTAKSDRPVYGFLTDLKERGLLDSTLVIWGGEMGRGPCTDINRMAQGRPHNPFANTIMMAGAGIKKGFSFGETDELSLKSVKDEVRFGDLWATVYHLMGIDHKKVVFSNKNNTEMKMTNSNSRILHEILS